jgi:hypothetical protein
VTTAELQGPPGCSYSSKKAKKDAEDEDDDVDDDTIRCVFPRYEKRKIGISDFVSDGLVIW